MKKALFVLVVLAMGAVAEAAPHRHTVHGAVVVAAKGVAKAVAKTSVAVAKSVAVVAKHL